MDGTVNNGNADWTKYNGNNWSTRDGQNNTGWSKDIPQGKYAGDYVVYYRVDADENHYDYINYPNDKVSVTINRAQQVISLNKTSTTYCVSWHEDFTSSRYEEAPLSLSSSGVINASLSGTTVQTSAKGSTGAGTATLSVPQTANYTDANATITVTVVNHDPKYKNTNPNVSCTVDGVDHYYCSWCNNHTTVTIPAWGHDMAQSRKEPTCTEEGYIRHYCTRGDYERYETLTKDPNNHSGSAGACHYYTDAWHYVTYSCCGGRRDSGHTVETKYEGCCYWYKVCHGSALGTCNPGQYSGQKEHHDWTNKRVKSEWQKIDGKWQLVGVYADVCHCGAQR